MGDALENLRHLIDCYGWRDNRDMQDFIDAADMIDMQYVELPKDADGEVWHVGDFAVGEVNPRNPKKIERMIWYGPDSGWQLETNTIIYPCPDRPRHHHKPTVEDVLREFGDWYTHTKGGCDEDGIIADYAAKLQLAGDAAGPNELALAYHVGFDDALAKRKPDANKVMQR